MWPFHSGFCSGYQVHFCCYFGEERSPVFAVSQHAPASALTWERLAPAGQLCSRPRVRATKADCAANRDPGRRSENPSGFMTEPTRRQRRSVSTCAGASTLGLLPQREPVCVIFVRSPHAPLQLPWRCWNGVKTGRLTSGCGSGVVLIWNLLLIPSSPGPTNIRSSPS